MRAEQRASDTAARRLIGLVVVALLGLAWLAEVRPSGASSADSAIRGPTRVQGAAGNRRIVIDSTTPTLPVRLLWVAGRAAAHDGTGSVVTDGGGGVMAFDAELVTRPIARADAATPVAAVTAASDGSIWSVDGSGLVTGSDRDGALRRTVRSSLPVISITADTRTGTIWAVRSSERFTYRFPGERSPLFERLGANDTAFVPVGQALIPEHGILADLANAGQLVVRGDTLWYAPFIRDEVIAMSATGDTLWRTVRGLPQTTTEPRFELDSLRRGVVNYHPVNLGLQLGPNGTLLVLSTPLGIPESGRLDELDATTGKLLASTELGTAFPSLAIDSTGRIHAVDPMRLIVPGGTEHWPLPDFDRPTRDGTRLRSSDLRGAPAVLNFWASWCGPCRKELPALDSLRRELEVMGVPIIGMNDDRDTVAARRFLDEVAPGFPTAYGRGELQNEFRYLGLPWTILVSSDGQVVARWIGELTATDLTEIRRAAAIELRRVTDAGGHGGHAGHGS